MTDEWEVTLHDGATIDSRVAIADLEMLRSLSKKDEMLLSRLYAQLQEGAPNDPELAAKYDEVFFGGGQLLDHSKRVFNNAIALTPGGKYEIVDPFVKNNANRIVLETIQENDPIHLERLARKLSQDGGDLSR